MDVCTTETRHFRSVFINDALAHGDRFYSICSATKRRTDEWIFHAVKVWQINPSEKNKNNASLNSKQAKCLVLSNTNWVYKGGEKNNKDVAFDWNRNNWYERTNYKACCATSAFLRGAAVNIIQKVAELVWKCENISAFSSKICKDGALLLTHSRKGTILFAFWCVIFFLFSYIGSS